MKNINTYDQFLFEERRRIIFKNRKAPTTLVDDEDKNLIDAITQWIDQKTPPAKSDKIADFLNKNHDMIKSLMKKNPDVYQSPIGETCYRGLERVSNMKQVIDLVKKGKFKKVSAPGYDGMITAIKIENYDYKPRRLAQSWSIDPDIPWKFSDSGIILETKIDGEFIMNPTYTSDINKTINSSGSDENQSGLTEEEVIHLGKKYKNVTLYIDIGGIEEDHELYIHIKDIL